MMLNGDMNKDKRRALIRDLTNDFIAVYTADDVVHVATAMADAASQGRTDRWKNACRYAGNEILTIHKTRGHVDLFSANDAVDIGLTLMVEANK